MERHSFCVKRPQTLFLIFLVFCTLCSGPLWAFGPTGSSSAGHHMYELKHISPSQGIAFLKRLNLGTATNMPCTKTLLITGGADVCQKAVAVLDLVDASEQFDVRQIASASSAPSLPSNDKIAAAVGDICIGTFANPPRETGKVGALIDVHNGAVWAIAPIFQLQNIALAVELGPNVLAQHKSITGGQGPKTEVVPSLTVQNTVADSEKITSSNPMPRTLLNSPLTATQFSAKPLAAPGLGILPPRASETERKPLALDLALAQVQTEAAMAALPPKPAGVPEAANPRLNLTPGQVVPAETTTPTLVTEAPEPILPDVAARTDEEPGLYTPIELLDEDRVINLKLPEKLPVIQLLDLVAKYTNLTCLYDPTQITGDVTLKLNGDLRGPMNVKDLYLLLESVLKFKNFVMTRTGANIVTIVKKDDALTIDPILVGPGTKGVEAGNVIVTRIFKLEHISTKSAQNLLDSMKLSVDVTPISESNTLIVTAYAHRMARLGELLDMVDKPGDPRKFQSRQLRYTMAKTLAEKVQALAEQLESVSVTVGSDSSEPSAESLTRNPGESVAAYNARKARARALENARRRAATGASGAAGQDEQTKPGVYLDADQRTNRILMIGVEEQLKVVEELIDSLDVEQQDLRSLKLYQMTYVEAEEVSRKLVELNIISRVPDTSNSSRISDSSRASDRTSAADRARAAAAVAANAAATGMEMEVGEEGPTEEPQVVVVESTNSLLVNGTPEQHIRIKEIISYIDNEMLRNEIPYQIYPLENSSPDHLATILNGLIEETTQNEDKEGKTQTLTQKREEDIEIVPDPNTYSLIVYASKRNQQWIADLVKQLDKRRPQVLIDVTLVEITKSDEFNYDLNMIENVTGLTNSALNPIGTASDSLETILSGPKGGVLDFQSNGGDFTGFYGDKHVQLLLNTVQSKNYGRVLAKPKILVNDNEEGTISTTETTYVELKSTAAIEGSQQAIQSSVSYDAYDAGIDLGITPHISEGNLLRLDINLMRSDFLRNTSIEGRPPDKTTSEIATAVTVPDGSTVILGGLLKLNQTKGGSKVPLLGDLPLLGGLFRSTGNTDNQSKLYIFVKAEIIRPAAQGVAGMEDLSVISERNRLAFEQHEKEFQDYQSWPGIKPKPMAPPEILKAQ